MKLTTKDRQAAIRKWLAEGLTQHQVLKALDELDELTRANDARYSRYNRNAAVEA